MALVTCAALLAALAQPDGGQTLRLSQDCGGVVVRHYYRAPVVIDAGGRTISSFVVGKGGGNLTLKGGTVTATGGEDAKGPPGYAVLLRGARDVTIDTMRFVRFNRGVVTDMAERIRVVNSRFELGGDGIIANGGGELDFSFNQFRVASFRPSLCRTGGTVQEGLSARVCKDRGGEWKDGWHQDAIQVRNGIDGLKVIGNIIEGVQQGIGQMDSVNDRPLNNVVIRDNQVSVSGFHSISIGNSTNVEIIGNSVAQTAGRRTLVRFPDGARVCGNKIQSPRDPGGRRC